MKYMYLIRKTVYQLMFVFFIIRSLIRLFRRSGGYSLSFGKFGKVFVYSQNPHPSNVVLFVSGDGGWNQGVVDMAKTLSSLDAIIVGIDITRYLRNLQNTSETCLYPSSDFEELSKFIQGKYKYQEYITPVLVGYSSGSNTCICFTCSGSPTDI